MGLEVFEVPKKRQRVLPVPRHSVCAIDHRSIPCRLPWPVARHVRQPVVDDLVVDPARFGESSANRDLIVPTQLFLKECISSVVVQDALDSKLGVLANLLLDRINDSAALVKRTFRRVSVVVHDDFGCCMPKEVQKPLFSRLVVVRRHVTHNRAGNLNSIPQPVRTDESGDQSQHRVHRGCKHPRDTRPFHAVFLHLSLCCGGLLALVST